MVHLESSSFISLKANTCTHLEYVNYWHVQLNTNISKTTIETYFTVTQNYGSLGW